MVCVICPLHLSSSPPHIIVRQFLSSGDVGPFPITEATKERDNGPQLYGAERRQRQGRSGATPLCCLNSAQSWLQTDSGPRRGFSEPLWGEENGQGEKEALHSAPRTHD